MRRRLFLVAGLMAALVSPSWGQVDEQTARAAVLVNVAKFVDWTSLGPQANGFVIAVAADEGFAGALTAVTRGARLHERDIRVRRLGAQEDHCACQVLFVSAQEESRSAALLHVSRIGVLTIGETAAFLREGGIVRVYREDDRLRFQISMKSVEGSGLQISSRLLSLAARTP
jgi:uncharacterized protein DUF4154